MDLQEATIKALTENLNITEEDEQFATDHDIRQRFGSNEWTVTIPASEKAKELAKKYNIEYYISADIESGPEFDDPDYYDTYSTDLKSLIAFYKEIIKYEKAKTEKMYHEEEK